VQDTISDEGVSRPANNRIQEKLLNGYILRKLTR
jgi:hypothetical protein